MTPTEAIALDAVEFAFLLGFGAVVGFALAYLGLALGFGWGPLGRLCRAVADPDDEEVGGTDEMGVVVDDDGWGGDAA